MFPLCRLLSIHRLGGSRAFSEVNDRTSYTAARSVVRQVIFSPVVVLTTIKITDDTALSMTLLFEEILVAARDWPCRQRRHDLRGDNEDSFAAAISFLQQHGRKSEGRCSRLGEDKQTWSAGSRDLHATEN